jgi:hypothetical protein
VATVEVKTVGEPARVVLSPDHDTIKSDGHDLSLSRCVWSTTTDFCPLADN